MSCESEFSNFDVQLARMDLLGIPMNPKDRLDTQPYFSASSSGFKMSLRYSEALSHPFLVSEYQSL